MPDDHLAPTPEARLPSPSTGRWLGGSSLILIVAACGWAWLGGERERATIAATAHTADPHDPGAAPEALRPGGVDRRPLERGATHSAVSAGAPPSGAPPPSAILPKAKPGPPPPPERRGKGPEPGFDHTPKGAKR